MMPTHQAQAFKDLTESNKMLSLACFNAVQQLIVDKRARELHSDEDHVAKRRREDSLMLSLSSDMKEL